MPQQFAYLLILDFEATCVQNGKPDPCQEIIEFPVFALNTSTWQVDHQFHTYVQPVVCPQLTEFCTNLTGITQEMVTGQPVIENVLKDFDLWLNETGLNEKKWAFVTCGDWDLKWMLPDEAGYKKIEFPQYFKQWINLKRVFHRHTGNWPKDMMEMLAALKIQHQGRHHSGIDDVRNITAIVRAIGCQAYQFKITGSRK